LPNFLQSTDRWQDSLLSAANCGSDDALALFKHDNQNRAGEVVGDSLFDRLGGAESVLAIVQDMYDRVLKDPELGHFFANSDLTRLRNMQFEFLASALGGPVSYSGAELQGIHAGRGITTTHFARFVGHLADAMEERGASKADIDEMLGQMAMYRDRIVGNANVDG
jgi:hemoglobin